MRIRPGLLFWGIFFLLLGGIPLLVRAGVLDANLLADAWRLWPLLLVALGIALILGRTSAGLLGTALAAVVLGVAAGGVLASGTGFIGNVGACGPETATDQRLQDGGTASGPMSASFDLDCGSLDVSTQGGSDWQVDAAYRGDQRRQCDFAPQQSLRATVQGRARPRHHHLGGLVRGRKQQQPQQMRVIGAGL